MFSEWSSIKAFGALDPGSNPGGAIMIEVLRLGHRRLRDHRISTHCGLVARAFDASKIIYSGEHDSSLLDSINNVHKKWGGSFSSRYVEKDINFIENYRGVKVHLTMYGLPIQKHIKNIRKHKKILLIVGGEKVPGEVYKLADYNIAVGHQPHSEVAALAIFLHEYFQGKELSKTFPKARLKILPHERGKNVMEVTTK